jgi:hypothetical protein
MQQEKFDQWAVIELFGHQQIAGRVSEAQIGGCPFVRVDVPEIGEQKGFTKFYGNGAIYAITITDEESARAAATYYRKQPMEEWKLRDMARALPEPDDGEPPY